jgi:hypothetical protein
VEENLDISSPSILIEKLIIVGRNKNYIVPFSSGLNIIYGDSDTGKSSILNIIDYLLGATEVDMYPELEMNGLYCLLQVKLNEKVYTIKRDLFETSAFIEVFNAEIENMESIYPREYGPNYKKIGPDGFYSDFLLQALNIPIIKVRQAPTKDDSSQVRMSFRDIFKYCYLDQDDVGSKNVLDNKNFSQYTKVKQTFKFIHKLLDTQIADLEEEVGKKSAQKRSKEESYNYISSFFRETQFGSIESLFDQLESINSEIETVQEDIISITSNMTSDTKQFDEIRQTIQQFQDKINSRMNEKRTKETQLEQKKRLKKNYELDKEKLESSLRITKKLSHSQIHHVDCPICEREMDMNLLQNKLGVNSTDTIERDIKHINTHFKSVNALIEEEIQQILQLDHQIRIFTENLNTYKDFLDIETNKFISPYVQQRDLLMSNSASLKEQKKKIEHYIKLRKQLNELHIESELLGTQITALKQQIESLKQNAPSISAVLQNVSDVLDDFLRFIPIRNPKDISINESTYLPKVRNTDYFKLTSGGLRTLVSIGFFISLLRNSIYHESVLPRFLMVDTVGKYLGKTSKPVLNSDDETDAIEDIKENITDPHKYENLYKYFIQLDEKFGQHMQFIIVDNDLPQSVEKRLQQFVVKEFRVDGSNDCEIGLIDDAK